LSIWIGCLYWWELGQQFTRACGLWVWSNDTGSATFIINAPFKSSSKPLGCEHGALILHLPPWSSTLPSEVWICLNCSWIENQLGDNIEGHTETFNSLWQSSSTASWKSLQSAGYWVKHVSFAVGKPLPAHLYYVRSHRDWDHHVEEPYLHRCPFMKLPWWLIVPHSTKLYS
jgi:hypothetical protein